jgi:hypothetical protein
MPGHMSSPFLTRPALTTGMAAQSWMATQPPTAWLCGTCAGQVTDPANALVMGADDVAVPG